jgi:hypothetical protein
MPTLDLIGYDAREMCFDLANTWPPDRRSAYLLKTDVPRPLSVDTAVWPSVFGASPGLGLYREERERVGLPGLVLPGWYGPNGGLWSSVADMLAYLGPRVAGAACNFEVVAVTLSPELAAPPGGPPYCSGQFAADDQWNFLGYDVADKFLLSGLSDCGYAASERPGLIARWAKCLNEHHLFTGAADACTFKLVADARVPEHRPFYVYAVWCQIPCADTR